MRIFKLKFRTLLMLAGIITAQMILPAAPIEAETKTLRVDQVSTGDHFVAWVQDQIIVQFKVYPSTAAMKKTGAGKVAFTDQELNSISVKFDIVEVEQQFKGAVKPFTSDKVDLSRHFKVTFLAGADPLEVVAAFNSNPTVEKAEPIGIHLLYVDPNDPFYKDSPNPNFDFDQWHYYVTGTSVEADQAWDSQTGDATVAVGILDTGTRYFHTDLGGPNALWGPDNPQSNGNIWNHPTEIPGNGIDEDGNGKIDDVIGWDFVTSAGGGMVQCIDQDCSGADNDPDDGNGHGTHVSGTVSAITNNNNRVAGVAGGFSDGTTSGVGNGVKIIPCRIGYRARFMGITTGVVRMDWAAEAMNYLSDLVDRHGVNIAAINASWGSSNSGGIDAAVNNLLAHDIMLIHAAGNSNANSPGYLGDKAGVLNVAATDINGNGASFTNFGAWVDVAAPGVTILSTYANPDDPDLTHHYIAVMSGTSMSAPHICGIAALLESCNSALSGVDKFNLIVGNTNPYFDEDDRDLGSGIASANLSLAAASCATCAEITPVAAFNGSPTSGDAPLTVNFTDQSTNNPASWTWDFGDGGSSSLQSPSHQYTVAGTYTVTLTASNCSGSDIATAVNFVTVTELPCAEVTPSANFSGNPTSGDAPLTVNFTDLSTNNPSSWSWDFGDGSGTSTAQNPNYIYSSAGTFTVSLTASNCAGSNLNTNVGYITVTQPPQNSMHVHDIVVTRVSRGPNWNGRATITIYDSNEQPVPDATIFVTADGPTGGTGSGATGADGTVSFKTSKTKNPVGEWCFEVTNVTHASNTYDQPGNHVTRACESGVVFGSVGDNTPIELTARPESYIVAESYPNPFNPSTKIKFTVPTSGRTTVTIYNALGQIVTVLLDRDLSAGVQTLEWNASGNSSGIYFYSIKQGENVVTRKMTLLK